MSKKEVSEDATEDQGVSLEAPMTIEELRAELAATKELLAKAKSPRKKVVKEAVSEDPEIVAAREAAIAEATAAYTAAETEFARAKAALQALRPTKGGGSVQRGPSGVGAYIKGMINDAKNNEEIMAAIAAEWPDNFTNVNCINWYRSAIKKWGPEGKRPRATAAVGAPLKGDESSEEVEDEAAVG